MIFVIFRVNKLIKCVKIENLNTCSFVNFLCAHRVKRLFLTDRVACVAVMHGIGKKRAVFIQKAVINTPSVNSDKVKTAVVVRLNNRLFYLVQKVQNVPEKISARPNAVVLETVNFFKRYFSAVKMCDNSASARRAEVYCKNFFHNNFILSKLNFYNNLKTAVFGAVRTNFAVFAVGFTVILFADKIQNRRSD